MKSKFKTHASSFRFVGSTAGCTGCCSTETECEIVAGWPFGGSDIVEVVLEVSCVFGIGADFWIEVVAEIGVPPSITLAAAAPSTPAVRCITSFNCCLRPSKAASFLRRKKCQIKIIIFKSDFFFLKIIARIVIYSMGEIISKSISIIGNSLLNVKWISWAGLADRCLADPRYSFNVQ